MITALLIVVTVALLAVAFVLTATESAFTYLPRHEAEKASQAESRASLRRVLTDPRPYMHALRFVRILCESLVTVTLTIMFLRFMPWMWLAAACAVVIATVLGFVVIGVTPRHVGRAHPLAVVTKTSGLLRFLTAILGPVPRLLMQGGSAVSPATEENAGFFTEEELREFVDRASGNDVLEDNEAAMLHSIFDLDDTRIRSVMVPRTDTVTFDLDDTLDNALNLFLRSGYSRIPVMGEDFDDVRGFLYLKDVAEAMFNTSATQNQPTVTSLLRPARFVPESQKVSELLPIMQREGTHVAIVVDEYGDTAGLVTLEDLIEELVGEIVDEYDAAEPEVTPEGDAYRISARTSISDLGELFDMDLEDDDVESVGGLLAKALGRVPIVGSSAEIYGIGLKAVKLEGRRNRVGTILVWRESAPNHNEAHTASEEH
ncbi:hemolysin family protein [Kocuria sp. HSID16901]|uniref:hemolysin family protein n=1 Tax=Kocuria sp. HSID16901 TaxID=2419505 RepID=UPI00066151C5|nr:hemolysin family protein [Kocuria sp. HSID16901]RUQ22622.1 HlyC/CorC family transporter [Kocuria sp. HSID16901]